MHVHHGHHSSRGHVTVISLQISLSLTWNKTVTVAKELYYIFFWNIKTLILVTFHWRWVYNQAHISECLTLLSYFSTQTLRRFLWALKTYVVKNYGKDNIYNLRWKIGLFINLSIYDFQSNYTLYEEWSWSSDPGVISLQRAMQHAWKLCQIIIYPLSTHCFDMFNVTWRSDWKSIPKQPCPQCTDLSSRLCVLEKSQLRQEQYQHFVFMAAQCSSVNQYVPQIWKTLYDLGFSRPFNVWLFNCQL